MKITTKTRKRENTKCFFRAFVVSCFRDKFVFGSGLSRIGFSSLMIDPVFQFLTALEEG